MESVSLFINRCMDKENVPYVHSRLLCGHKIIKILFAGKYSKLNIMLLSEINPIQKHKYLSFFYMQNLDLKMIEYKICM